MFDRKNLEIKLVGPERFKSLQQSWGRRPMAEDKTILRGEIISAPAFTDFAEVAACTRHHDELMVSIPPVNGGEWKRYTSVDEAINHATRVGVAYLQFGSHRDLDTDELRLHQLQGGVVITTATIPHNARQHYAVGGRIRPARRIRAQQKRPLLNLNPLGLQLEHITVDEYREICTQRKMPPESTQYGTIYAKIDSAWSAISYAEVFDLFIKEVLGPEAYLKKPMAAPISLQNRDELIRGIANEPHITLELGRPDSARHRIGMQKCSGAVLPSTAVIPRHCFAAYGLEGTFDHDTLRAKAIYPI
jgi:hypothetical protein